MVEKFINMKTYDILSLVDGRKTQHRVLLKPQPQEDAGLWLSERSLPHDVGNLLWVREVWGIGCRPCPVEGCFDVIEYKADGYWCRADADTGSYNHSSFLSPATMPRWASRITLIVTSVRVERLQDISEDGAIAEGLASVSKDGRIWKYGVPDQDGLPSEADYICHWQNWNSNPRNAFANLWNHANGTGAWDENPWVAVIGFDIIHANIDKIGCV